MNTTARAVVAECAAALVTKALLGGSYLGLDAWVDGEYKRLTLDQPDGSLGIVPGGDR
ncbi:MULTISPECIES: hypothetical protein [Haloferax]|uniref:Uncharacterized protein n=1 Tax=Haloferax mediterranei (strain ATCC 33500 / DSM 1411 / JCM 8866 / NBRC 14739 / NCIMB 2177 / R-4) TaxID=523841 RepID=I3R3Q3_HALMT|nr:hypothetical protein [Haloferax mediterranei]AFK18863.1 hypothetical protein HFX_1147 [Haloferax mediterranei ATCC 33500]EMA03279.1 hypothetical protein C439_04755 [Haloferax mediterranei ATCC 33500]MDX5988956.1 hypothetical protein [Haloferax mediterranei ATCC 33500]